MSRIAMTYVLQTLSAIAGILAMWACVDAFREGRYVFVVIDAVVVVVNCGLIYSQMLLRSMIRIMLRHGSNRI